MHLYPPLKDHLFFQGMETSKSEAYNVLLETGETHVSYQSRFKCNFKEKQKQKSLSATELLRQET